MRKPGLAFRGHRDDWVDRSDESSSNQGNFVHFWAEPDPVLATHLQEAPKNARYTSKGIQNKSIDVVGQSIQLDIISKVQAAQFYSITADVVKDVANKELSLVLRYIYNEEIKEIFVDFIQVERITGEVLGSKIVDWLTSHNLCLSGMHAWSMLQWGFKHVWCSFWV